MQTNEPHMFAEISSSNIPLELLPEAQEITSSKNSVSSQLDHCSVLVEHFTEVDQVLPTSIGLTSDSLTRTIESVKDLSYSDITAYQCNPLKCGETDFAVNSPNLSFQSQPCREDCTAPSSLHSKETSNSSKDILKSDTGTETSYVPLNSVTETSMKTRSTTTVRTRHLDHRFTDNLLDSDLRKKGKAAHSKVKKKRKISKQEIVPNSAVKLALQTLQEVRQETSDRSFWFGRYIESEMRTFPETYQTEFITHVLKLVQIYKQKTFT